MNKKDKSIKNLKMINDDTEIKKVVNTKNVFQNYLLIMLSLMFIIMLICSFVWVDTFYKNRDKTRDEVIEIKNDKNSILIVNNGDINEELTIDSFNNEENITIERINSLELTTFANQDENGKLKYNLRYIIEENPFVKNNLDNTNSDVLVKFSYSYDKEDWTYINNVVSTDTSTILPLMGKNYDIAGVNETLRVITNEELEVAPGESQTIYWRSETIIKNFKKTDVIKNFKAKFKIEYCSNS